ncbi:MAG TPA: hydrogenase 4 subunit B [Hyphomicrobiaceae bacterium]|nr:hydrogenase 4 subunit B [Hyphomicrobiaceae bacterium]
MNAAAHLHVLAAALGAYLLTAVAAIGLARRTLVFVYPLCLIAAAVACLVDLSALLASVDARAHLPLGLPSIGLRFRLDALSAFFGLIVNFGVLAASLYGLGFDPRTELSGRVEPFFPAFAAAMNLVLLADDAFAFLFSWEVMSLTSWALVVARHDDAECRQAGYVYLLMAAIGTAALLFAFGGLAGAVGGYGFQDIRASHIDPLTSALILTAVIVGAGSKAGIIPLHAWLPLAHPAAPSHVSALMSGVMTKVAIYGVIRIVFDLLGGPQWWWSLPFILLGSASAVGGLLYAVLDQDLKRVLAYSTIENVGIIFVAIGFAIAFKATGLQAAAVVATAAGLLHALNHSWFKSLLFLGAGAVLHATGRRDFDGLGGLIHRMPRTAFCWFVGALSISALPPLNGFVSEWLLFQSVLAGPAFSEPILRSLVPAVGAMLALAAGLAAACFVRAFGVAFLGRPRSPAAAAAHEAPLPQQAAMALLTASCILGGLCGSVAISAIGPLLMKLAGAALPATAAGPTPLSIVAFDPARSTYDAPIIALFVAISAITTTLIVHWVSNRRTRRSAAWDCGFPEPSPMTQYTGSSFGQPLRRLYGSIVFGAEERVYMPAPGNMQAARLEVRLTDYSWRWFYVAPAGAVTKLAARSNPLQFLTIRRYLVLMFLALILLLLITAMWV